MQDAGTGDNIIEKQGNGNKPALKRPASTFILIDAHHAIGADAHSWHILQKRRYKGGYRWEPIVWYATREQCVHGLWQHSVKTCGAQSLARTIS
jgi:hypothetical protein